MSLTITYNGKPVKPSIIDQLNMPDCEATRKYIEAFTAPRSVYQLTDEQGEGSILDRLKKCQIFGIENRGGMFEIFEECDHYFSCFMSKDELIQLSDEIRILAEATDG